MKAAVLTRLGTRTLAVPAQRAVLLVAVVSLHALLVYFLATGASRRRGRTDASVIEAESFRPIAAYRTRRHYLLSPCRRASLSTSRFCRSRSRCRQNRHHPLRPSTRPIWRAENPVPLAVIAPVAVDLDPIVRSAANRPVPGVWTDIPTHP